MNSVIIRDATIFDPMNGLLKETGDIFIDEGRITTSNALEASDTTREINAGGRITIPGGVFLHVPIPLSPLDFMGNHSPVNSVNSITNAGFTTIVNQGFAPFNSHEAHQWLAKVRNVNKVPIIDLGNFQFFLNFLKNGITNYALETTGIVLDSFKGYGLALLQPGSTLRWNSRQLDASSILEPLPFLGTSVVDLINEAVKLTFGKGQQPGSIMVQTGIEGEPRGFDITSQLLSRVGGNEKNSSALGMHSLLLNEGSMLVAGSSKSLVELPNEIDKVKDLMKAHEFSSFFAGIPPLQKEITFVEPGPSSLQSNGDILARVASEGESYRVYFKIKDAGRRLKQEIAWAASIKMFIDLPSNNAERLAFSLKPVLLNGPGPVVDIVGSLLSSAYRNSCIEEHVIQLDHDRLIDILGDGEMTLSNFIQATRSVPSMMLGIQDHVGGIGMDQLGDIVVLDATPAEWNDALKDPEQLKQILLQPYLLLNQGTITMSNTLERDGGTSGITFLNKLQKNESIHQTVYANFDKTFLKYYSTHLDSKMVTEGDIPRAFLT